MINSADALKAAIVGLGLSAAIVVLATLAATVLTLQRQESVSVLGLATGVYDETPDGSFEFSISSGPALVWFVLFAPLAAIGWTVLSERLGLGAAE